MQSRCQDVPGPVAICSYYIDFASLENLVLNMSTSQSSVDWGGVSGRAVDGNSDRNYDRKTCTHTIASTTNPWWRADMGSSHSVSEVFLVNRASIRERLVNIEIRVGKKITMTVTLKAATASNSSSVRM